MDNIPDINPLKANVTTYVMFISDINVSINPSTRPVAAPATHPFFHPKINTNIRTKILNIDSCIIVIFLKILSAIATTITIAILSSLENTYPFEILVST